MNKIINLSQAQKTCKQLKKAGKTLVLVGGCFDIFHYGHFIFLKEAKKLGDILIVALESDQKVKEIKGKGRPITPVKARAEILSALTFVDYVLILPYLQDDKSYSNFTILLRPDIIAVTMGDKRLKNKKKLAKLVGAKVVEIPYVKTPSTSQILKIIVRET